MSVSISAGFEKLLREPAYCQLATLMADGSPQITQVWVDTDGEHILVNTAEGRQKTVRDEKRDLHPLGHRAEGGSHRESAPAPLGVLPRVLRTCHGS